MRTEALIGLLAREAGPVSGWPGRRRIAAAAGAGLVASALLALGLLGPLAQAVFRTPAPWIKLVYAGLLAAAAIASTVRLARPGPRSGRAEVAVLGVVAAMFALGGAMLVATPADLRPAALLGRSAWVCPFRVMLLSLPALAAILWALRSLAPTRLPNAGAAAGLLAGALGAAGYALSCPETSVSFVALWYTAGIALSALLGRWLGPRVLRW
jgi:hypothetical protein